jgi:hypothetical protein
MQHKITNSWNTGVSVTVTAPMFLFLSVHFATSLSLYLDMFHAKARPVLY